MRASRELRPAHAAVLRALEVANTALGRAVTIDEIIEAMTPDERRLVRSSYKNTMSGAVGIVLALLVAPVRGLVFQAGNTPSRRRCFASRRVLRPEDAALPEAVTVRELMLTLVRHTVQEFGRAVRVTDLIEFARGRPEYARLSEAQIQHSIDRAHRIGDVASLSMRGNLRNLYVPADLNPEDYAPPRPLTWLERVRAAFDSRWDEHVQEAHEQGRLPRPITTSQVRTRLQEMGCDEPKMAKNSSVVTALFDLANKGTPVVRRISRRSRKSVFWCPASISDSELDLGNAYASDLERIGAACARAAARYERPVSLREIKAEMESDPALRIRNAVVSASVSSAADPVERDDQIRSGRKYNYGVILHVGRVRGRAFYYPPGKGIEQALGYVEFRQHGQEWRELRADEHLYDLQSCRLPTVAFGRARLLAAQTRRILGRLRGMVASGELVGRWADEAEVLIEQMDDVATRAGAWPTPIGGQDLPERPSTICPTLTNKELSALFAPIYPQVQKYERLYSLTSLLVRRIRRVAAVTGGPQLYDRTDALLFAARRFGGRECVFLAGLAGSEIGMLRDPAFIYPAVEAADPDMRLAAVACLAFVWSEEGNKLLKTRAMKDAETGIRQSALWAARFAGADMARELATVLAKHDESAEVREFAAQVAEADAASIWLL